MEQVQLSVTLMADQMEQRSCFNDGMTRCPRRGAPKRRCMHADPGAFGGGIRVNAALLRKGNLSTTTAPSSSPPSPPWGGR